MDFQNYVRTQVEPNTRGQLVAGASAVIGLGTTGGVIAAGGGAAVATSSAIGGFFGGLTSIMRGGSLSDVLASTGKGAVSSAFTSGGGAAGKAAGTPGLVAGEVAGAYAGAKATGATDYEANVSAGQFRGNLRPFSFKECGEDGSQGCSFEGKETNMYWVKSPSIFTMLTKR